MKIIVKKKQDNYYGEEFDVVKMNYDNVLACDRNTGTRINFRKTDIKFKGDNDYEKAIEKCNDLLKIKLSPKMSIALYQAIYEAIFSNIGQSIKHMDVIKDNDRKLKKGLWEKIVLVAVNKTIYLELSIVGRNYSQRFEMYVKTIDKSQFAEECAKEMQRLTNEKEIAGKKIKEFKKYLELKC